MDAQPTMTPGMKSFSQTFLDLLDRWNRRHSLTALPPEAREEELIQDSLILQPWIVALEPGAKVVDFGTGMGIPALVLAALRADIQVVAVDKTAKKLAFVRQAALELGLGNLQAFAGRIEEIPPLQGAIGTAKAVGPLPLLLGWWERHGTPGSKFLALKGPAWQEELPVPGWSFRAHPYHLPTRGQRVVVEAWKGAGISG